MPFPYDTRVDFSKGTPPILNLDSLLLRNFPLSGSEGPNVVIDFTTLKYGQTERQNS